MSIGPIVREQNIRWPTGTFNQWFKHQQVYKTSPGDNRIPLPYEHRIGFMTNPDGQMGSGNVAYSDCFQSQNNARIAGRVYQDYYRLSDKARNRARQVFLETLKETRNASIGAALAQIDQTCGMVTARATQLLAFAKALRGKRWRKAAAILGIQKPPWKHGWRPASKSFGSQFLEYSFGWVPTIGDIHDGVEVLSAPYPDAGLVRGRGRNIVYQEKVVSSQTPFLQQSLQGHFGCWVEIRGFGEMVNPNLALAERLGLVNPVAIAWEVVPFSFVVDYFAGYGDYFNSLTDEVGWNLRDVSTTTASVCKDGEEWNLSRLTNSGEYNRGRYYETVFASHFRRTVGATSLPSHAIVYQNPFKGLSIKRAATSVALLTQFLSTNAH